MLKGPIARSTIRTAIVLGGRLFVQAATLLLLVSVLGPKDFGIYAGVGAIAVLVGTLATFGTHLTLWRDISRNLTGSALLSKTLGTTSLCSLALFSLYVPLVQVYLPALGDLAWLVLGFGISEILLQPFLMVAAMEIHGRGRVASSQFLLMQPLFIRLFSIFIIWSLQLDNSLAWYVPCHILATLFPLAFVVALAPAPQWRSPWRWTLAKRTEWRELSGYALMSTSANGLAELDKVAATRFLPSEAAGIYSAGSRIVGSLVIPVIALVLAVMPRLFRAEAQSVRKLHFWLFVSAGLYGLTAAVGISVISPLIESLLGDAYKGIGEVVYLLSFSVPAVSLRATAMNVLTTLERPWLRIMLEIAGWCCIFVFAFFLFRQGVSSGMAIAIVVTEWLLAAVAIFFVITISACSSELHGVDVNE